MKTINEFENIINCHIINCQPQYEWYNGKRFLEWYATGVLLPLRTMFLFVIFFEFCFIRGFFFLPTVNIKMMTAPTIANKRTNNADVMAEKVAGVNPSFSRSLITDMVLVAIGCWDEVSVMIGSWAEVLPVSVVGSVDVLPASVVDVSSSVEIDGFWSDVVSTVFGDIVVVWVKVPSVVDCCTVEDVISTSVVVNDCSSVEVVFSVVVVWCIEVSVK